MDDYNNKNLYLLLISILMMGLVVAGGTFAYFQWTTNAIERTSVNVTIAAGGIKMTITQEDGQFETAGLRPVADCKKSYAYMDALVEIDNTTGTLAVPSFKLKGKVTSSGTLSSYDLEHIHYSVVNLGSVSSTNYSLFADDDASCDEPETVTSGGIFTNNYSLIATGTFGNVSTTGGWTDMPSGELTNYIARSYNTGVSSGITFIGHKAGEGYLKEGRKDFTWNVFRVYVWIDENYTYTNVGNVVSDPLQNATIWVQWSENSIIEQVAGASEESVTNVLVPGLYDDFGVLQYAWDELTNVVGSISVFDTALNASFEDLGGVLLIPKEITSIGNAAFYNSGLTKVLFEENSQLVSIGDSSFEMSYLESIEIPASVTEIGSSAFAFCESLDIIIYKGTVSQWNSIEFGASWHSEMSASEVICSDGVVPL